MIELQKRLQSTYSAWKTGISVSMEDAARLSPPLLISVPAGYKLAKQRILFLGQETYGWGWTSQQHLTYPLYKNVYPFSDVCNFADFVQNGDAVEALCWAYKEFDFASKQPKTRRAPFWGAFQEVQRWPGAGVMWGNLSRCDFNGGSILAAPAALVDDLAEMQARLLADEISILKPHVCLFFTGPNYDVFLSTIFPNIRCEPVRDLPVRKLARLSHPHLPKRSFRTYHPASLSRQKLWGFIEELRLLSEE